jgi:CDP-4-dehydro-6-deoxyglucose reductase, E3
MTDTDKLDLAPPQPFRAELIRKRELAPGVCEFGFRVRDAEGNALPSFRFEAGQWVNLAIPGFVDEKGHPLKRAYSIASHPTGAPEFELAVTKVDDGPGSTFLHAMKPGETLDAIGPHGLFLRREHGPALFVGTGTGLTPLRSMFRSALAKGASKPMALIFGVRTESDIIYRDELLALEREHPNFKVYFTLSRGDSSWQGRHGYVQTHVAELYRNLAAGASVESQPHVYICGLQKMVSAVRDLLKGELGLPRTLIHSERYD